MPTLLLVDDHPLFRAALCSVLERGVPDLTIAQVGSVAEGLQHCLRSGPPNLVLLDLGLPDVHGEQAVRAWRTAHPDLPVVMLSATTDQALIDQGLAAGAHAFIHKSDPPQRMLTTLAPWLMGPTNAPGGAAAETPPDTLAPSPRQLEVLSCLCRGLTTSKAIARELGLSEYTVRQHLADVYRRLGVNNRAQAIVAAQAWLAPSPGANPAPQGSASGQRFAQR